MKINYKKLSIVLLAILLVMGGYIGYVKSTTPTSTFYISSGIYPNAVSYTIWIEGTNYFAKDAYGLNAFSDTNASNLIISVLTSSTIINYGGTVYFKSGIYQLDTQIAYAVTTSTNGYVKFQGENKINTILNGSSLSVPTLNLTSTHGQFILSNIRIGGGVLVNGGSQYSFEDVYFGMYSTASAVPLLDIEATDDSSITNCVFDYGSSGGLLLNNGLVTDVRISNCLFYENTGYNIKINGTNIRDITISHCYIESGGTNLGAGIYISYAYYIRIEDNTINGYASTSYNLITITGTGAYMSYQNTIMGNNIYCSSYSNKNHVLFLDYSINNTIIVNTLATTSIGSRCIFYSSGNGGSNVIVGNVFKYGNVSISSTYDMIASNKGYP